MARLTCPDGKVGDPGCLNALADREGFAVVYPNGTPNPQHPRGGGRRWNAGGGKHGYGCAGGFACEAGIDDLAYFRDLLDDLEGAVSIDRARMYATGISNGGSMSHRLACELADRIAAIASVAAGNQFAAVETCAPGRAVPVLQIHGTDDTFWPYKGGEAREAGVRVSIPETIRGWVERNGCAASPDVSLEPDRDPTDGTRARRESYGACRDGAEVVFYTVEGGGHTWPGGLQYLPTRLIGKTSRDLDANTIIWDFFRRYALPAQEIRS